MNKFTDTEARDWIISINVQAVKEVREKCDVDLLDVGGKDGDVFLELVSNPITLVNVLYVLCEKQATEREISDEDFGRAMAGDVIDAATSAFVQALVNFTPNRRDRARIQTAWEKVQKYLDLARDKLQERMNDPATDAMLESKLDAAMADLWPDPEASESAPGTPSTSTPESSG